MSPVRRSQNSTVAAVVTVQIPLSETTGKVKTLVSLSREKVPLHAKACTHRRLAVAARGCFPCSARCRENLGAAGHEKRGTAVRAPSDLK